MEIGYLWKRGLSANRSASPFSSKCTLSAFLHVHSNGLALTLSCRCRDRAEGPLYRIATSLLPLFCPSFWEAGLPASHLQLSASMSCSICISVLTPPLCAPCGKLLYKSQESCSTQSPFRSCFRCRCDIVATVSNTNGSAVVSETTVRKLGHEVSPDYRIVFVDGQFIV